MDTRQKKQLGSWGEKCVESAMATLGWRVAQRNHRFSGGETDRIFCKDRSEARASDYCVAEIKTLQKSSPRELWAFLSQADCLATLCRPRQMRNLFVTGARLRGHSHGAVFIRLFVVAKFSRACEPPSTDEAPPPFCKIISRHDEFIIVSLMPECDNFFFQGI